VEGGAGFSGSPLQKRWFLSSWPPFPIHRPRNDLSVTYLNGCYGLQLKATNGPGKGRKEAEKEVENLEVRALTAKVSVLPTGIHHHLLGLHLLLGGLVPGWLHGVGAWGPDGFVPGSSRDQGNEGMGVNNMLCAIGGQLEQVGSWLSAIGWQQGQSGGDSSGLRMGDDVSGRVRYQVGICFSDVPGVGVRVNVSWKGICFVNIVINLRGVIHNMGARACQCWWCFMLGCCLICGAGHLDQGLVVPIRGVQLACHKRLLNFCLQNGIHR
jgi:hypothetical protein